MSCRHNLANGTCIRCYPDNPDSRSDRVDPGPEERYFPNLDGPGAEPAASISSLAAGIAEAGGTLPYPGDVKCASADPDPSVNLKRRVAKMLWIQVAKSSNPWFDAAASGITDYRKMWEEWNHQQLELTRSLHAVIFDGAETTDTLLVSALDFVGG